MLTLKHKGIHLSIFLFTLTFCSLTTSAPHLFIDNFPVHFLSVLSKSPYHFYKNILLLRSGDIEEHPGPVRTVDSNICIVHVNTASLRNKIDLLEAECHKYDIITISETWLTNQDNNQSIALPNFNSPVRLDRPNDPHGGVAIYVRNTIQCKPRPDLHVPHLEAVWIETRLNQVPLLVGSFYRPPNSHVDYWALINESISKANDDMKRYIVLGDFNTDWLLNPSKHLLDITHLFNLHQAINKPTRITNFSSKCLDLIFTQSPDIIVHSDVAPAFCSDHSTPYVKLKCVRNGSATFERTIYNYNELDKYKFIALLNEESWMKIISDYTIDESCELLTNTIMELAKKCMPSKTVKIRLRDSPWMNSEIRILLKRRNKIHKRARKCNKAELWSSFRNYRNYVIDRIRNRQRQYFEELNDIICSPDKFGSKQWWKLVNKFLCKKGSQAEGIPPIEHNGTLHYNNKDKANVFNEIFVSQSSLDDPNSPLPHVDFHAQDLSEIQISEQDVKNEIKKLTLNKATGPDKIHNILLIAASDVLAKPLSSFFNRCLEESKFPTPWKLAHVTPVYKKGNKDDCTNYRPISLLSCVGKLLERCVHKHVNAFLTENELISSSQSGFQTGDSTVNQLVSIYNNFAKHYDQGITTQAIFFDISKAFDRVWHKGLLLKLNSLGVRGKLLEWFQDYLSHRTQIVVLGGETSDPKELTTGVPQGSVLGPLLFLVYINDIVCNIESIMKLFADDTSMSNSHTNPEHRAKVLNSDLLKVELWSKNWKVKFNDTKTELMNFNRDNLPNPNLYFSQTLLLESTQHKHLGLILQNNCKWREHVNYIIKKVSPLINCLKSLKYRLTRKPLETMYKSFILPIFDYSDILWDNCTAEETNQLESLQLQGLRIITGLIKGTSHALIYKESGICSLKKRRERHKLIAYHKIVNGNAPQYLIDLLPPLVADINPYHRRRPLERSVPPHKTEIYRTSFFPSTTHLWNNLPEHIQSSTSLSAFKRFITNSDTIVPPHFYAGKRNEQILHCRMRNNMSNLNSDLQKRHLSPSASCTCGYSFESSEHYLLNCPLFTNIRATTIATLEPDKQNIETLLYGDSNCSTKANEHIFIKVHDFIRLSKRFD